MDDIQYSDSSSDDEMLDDTAQSRYDELQFSPHAVNAAEVTSPKPDHDVSSAMHTAMDPTASPSPACSQDLEGDYEGIFASRVHPPAVQQQFALAASPEDVTPTIDMSVLARIENIFEAMADVLLNERGQLSVELVIRPRVSRRDIDLMDSTQSVAVQRLCFPGKTEREAWRFGEHGLAASACSLTDHI
jgi:hypothetical protein